MVKVNNLFLAFVIFMVLICTSPISSETETNSNYRGVPYSNHIISDYIQHAPISVTSDNFAAAGFTGSGTFSDPYVLEGYNITGEYHAIEISSCSDYYVIRNCILTQITTTTESAFRVGLYITNSPNGLIESCIITSNEEAVRHKSDYCVYRNNTIRIETEDRSNRLGINVGNSDHLILHNNTIRDCGRGITLGGCVNVTITNNTIHSNLRNGIDAIYTSDSIFANNTFYGHGVASISLGWCSNCTVNENTFVESVDTTYGGVYLWISMKCIITNNNFVNCTPYIYGSEEDEWYHEFVNNTVNGLPLVHYHNITDQTIDASGFGQVIVTNSTSVSVHNSTFSQVTAGLIFYHCTESSFRNITISPANQGLVLFNSANSTINNCTIEDANDGLYVWDSFNCTISNSTFIGGTNGIVVGRSNNSTFYNNTLLGVRNGIGTDSSYCVIDNNFVTNSERGISLQGGQNVITNNILTQCGVWLGAFVQNFSNNEVNGKPIGYFRNQNDTLIDCSPYGQVFLVECTEVTVTNLVSINSTVSVEIAHCTNSTIRNSTCVNNFQTDLYVTYSDGTIIDNCTVVGSFSGIQLVQSDNCVIKQSNIHNHSWGLYLDGSFYGVATQNRIYENEYGVWTSWAQYCQLLDNEIFDNEVGVNIAYGSEYFEVIGGRIFNNQQEGIRLDATYCTIADAEIFSNLGHGVSITDLSHNGLLDNNTIHHNSMHGVYIFGINNFQINDNEIFQNTLEGIHCDSNYRCEITNNEIYHHSTCVNITNSPETQVEFNIIHGSSDYGLHLNGSDNCYFEGNEFYNHTYYGFYILRCEPCSIIDCLFYDIEEYSIFLDWSNDIIVRNCEIIIYLGSYAIHLTNSYYCDIKDNTIYGYGGGIYSEWGDNNNFQNNTIHGTAWYGIQIFNGDNTTVLDNTIYNVTFNAIEINDLLYANVSGNIVYDNQIGIRLQMADECIITDNTIYDNTEIGIFFVVNSDGNTIYNNTIGWNTIRNAQDDGTSNSWDDGASVGNFWHDYGGVGTYTIYGLAGSVDNYPGRIEPMVVSHGDVQINHGTVGNTITWTVTGLHPDSYVVYENDSLIFSDDWNGSPISVPIDGLEKGVYEYRIVVNNTIGLTASDIIIVIVLDETDPTINGPAIIQYEAGSTNNTITWDPNDPYPSTWQVFRNGTSIANGLWNSTTETITMEIDGLAFGVYNYTLVVVDESGNSAALTSLVMVTDTTAPTVNSPSNVYYEIGSTSTTITWNPSDLFPDSWQVIRIDATDSEIFDSGLWNSSLETITITILETEKGVFNYTLIIYDSSGNFKSDTVLVIAQDTTPPAINSPADIIFTEGVTGNTIEWQVSDEFPDRYDIYSNGTIVQARDWSGGNIEFSVDSFLAGFYNITIIVYDDGGLLASDMVLVTVTASTITTTTPPPSLIDTLSFYATIISIVTAFGGVMIGLLRWFRRRQKGLNVAEKEM